MSERQPIGYQQSARYRPSPRTAAVPMAFTGWEFIRGALAAWGWFVVLFAPATALCLVISLLLNAGGSPVATGNVFSVLFSIPFIITTAGVYAAPLVAIAYIYAAPWMIAGLLVGAPLAYGLGMALRRNVNHTVHVVVFATLGLVLGAAATTAGAAVSSDLTPDVPSVVVGAIVTYSTVTAVAVVLGWWFTMSRALRVDARAITDSGTSTGT